MIKEINLLLNKNKINIKLDRETNIDFFEMDKDYFLDVFWTRYEISLKLKRPIIGLKEVLNNVEKIKKNKLLSTSFKINNTEIILYSDELYLEFYGITYFGDELSQLPKEF